LERSLPPAGIALASSIVLVPLGTLIGVVAAPGERWEVSPGTVAQCASCRCAAAG
jgi:hypothetical protein